MPAATATDWRKCVTNRLEPAGSKAGAMFAQLCGLLRFILFIVILFHACFCFSVPVIVDLNCDNVLFSFVIYISNCKTQHTFYLRTLKTWTTDPAHILVLRAGSLHRRDYVGPAGRHTFSRKRKKYFAKENERSYLRQRFGLCSRLIQIHFSWELKLCFAYTWVVSFPNTNTRRGASPAVTDLHVSSHTFS